MTVINPNSISGITSITLPSGDGNVLTIHTNDGTERFRIDSSGNVKVGSACTISQDGDVFFTGVTTATTFTGAHSGSGANLTSLPAAQLSGTLPAISATNLTNIPAANVTGTLPAISAANLTNIPAANVTGTLPAITAANLTNIPAANIVGVATAGFARSGGFGGITDADVWRLSTDVGGNSSGATLTSWERADDAVATYIGDGMSHSSGIFTFPSTGKWLIQVQLTLYGAYAFGWGYIQTAFKSSGSGSYDGVAEAFGNVAANSGFGGGFSQVLVDVTESGGSGAAAYFDQTTVSTAQRYIGGSSTKNKTSVSFIRIGDT